jgi:hypothetical protein
MLFINFFASIDTLGVNEAFSDGHASSNPNITFTFSLITILMLLILSGKKTIEIKFPRNWKQFKKYVKEVWYGEPNTPS